MLRVFIVYYENSDSIFPCDRAPSLRSLRPLTARVAAWSCDEDVEAIPRTVRITWSIERLRYHQRRLNFRLGDNQVSSFTVGLVLGKIFSTLARFGML